MRVPGFAKACGSLTIEPEAGTRRPAAADPNTLNRLVNLRTHVAKCERPDWREDVYDRRTQPHSTPRGPWATTLPRVRS